MAVTTNDARFDADDVTWAASGGSIDAAYGILYNDTDANDPPLAFIDFDGAQSACDGTDFKVVWNVSGIFTFTVALCRSLNNGEPNRHDRRQL